MPNVLPGLWITSNSNGSRRSTHLVILLEYVLVAFFFLALLPVFHGPILFRIVIRIRNVESILPPKKLRAILVCLLSP